MKQQLQQAIHTALQALQQQNNWLFECTSDIQVERTRDGKNGDFACNIALILAKTVNKKPRELAELLVAQLPASDLIAKIEIAGPGFINFFLVDTAFQHVINEILAARSSFGTSKTHAGTRIHMEYVSSNPTGPLHVGHGRSAAFGASLANILEAVGFTVHREYYVNDAGRQMNILATSVWLRYLELAGKKITFPVNGYRGDYVKDIAIDLTAQVGEALQYSLAEVYANVPADANGNSKLEIDKQAKEAHINGLIRNAQQLLGEGYQTIFSLALKMILDDIHDDLAEYQVTYDEWFSEQRLVNNGAIDRAIQILQEKDYLYEQEGALWFASSQFGDDKDRVVQRANGQRTYFANDIAYHLSKIERGYDHIVDVFGADHHGYVPRMQAAMQAFSGKRAMLVAPLLQFVSLYRGKEKLAMSTRGGNFVTLRALRDEVGNDAARFFYVLRKANQHMDFDLELAKAQSNENPVYYIQYAHARICSVFRQLAEKEVSWSSAEGIEYLNLLIEPNERALFGVLARYPEVITLAARDYEPYLAVQYLRELAASFHAYYNSHQFIVDDKQLCQARLSLIAAVRQVIENGLALLGVSSPEKM